MIIQTENSMYELDQRHRRIRRIGSREWEAYDGNARVVVGEPLRLYRRTSNGSPRTLSSYRVLTTSPVLEIFEAEDVTVSAR